MKRIHGFTLIELLVVIAIIALVMGIMMPALQRVRKQAAGSVCLSNQHQLVLAWIIYAQDNGYKLIGGHGRPGIHAPSIQSRTLISCEQHPAPKSSREPWTNERN